MESSDGLKLALSEVKQPTPTISSAPFLPDAAADDERDVDSYASAPPPAAADAYDDDDEEAAADDGGDAGDGGVTPQRMRARSVRLDPSAPFSEVSPL